MKKIALVLSILTCVSAHAESIGGHCGSGAEVGQLARHNGQVYKVQYVTKNSQECKGMDQYKLVHENEFIAPALFEKHLEGGSWFKMLALRHVGLPESEQQKIIIKNCLIENNFKALSCFPKSDFQIASEECLRIGFQLESDQHKQCTMVTLQNIRQNNAIKEAANAQAAEIRRINNQIEHNAMMNRLQQQTQPQPQVNQGFRNYECRERLGGRIECTGY